MVIAVHISGDSTLIGKLREALVLAGLRPHQPARMRNVPSAAEIKVALGLAGAFTAVCKVVAKLLERHKGRELKIERAGCFVTLKWNGLVEEKVSLRMLLPELLQPRPADGGTVKTVVPKS